eukprot:251611-Prorocentrum_minimum.AAC.1
MCDADTELFECAKRELLQEYKELTSAKEIDLEVSRGASWRLLRGMPRGGAKGVEGHMKGV